MERTESRIFLLYCTKKEAQLILAQASLLGLTGKNYIWIATQAVIGKYFAFFGRY
jgi:ionotropic glutamate receptor NMDA 2B